MELNKANYSRDYLYGRLLAVAENLESYALHLIDEDRPTNAERYFQRFAQSPYKTWTQIFLSLRPYLNRMKTSQKDIVRNTAIKRENELSEITNLFIDDEYNSPNPLTGEFLLGYHSQRMSYRKTSDTTSTDDTNNQAEPTTH